MRAAEWQAITDAAMRQGGLVTSAQLHLAGASPFTIADAIRDGRLVRVRKGVVAVAGAPIEASRPIRAAAMALREAVISHRSAAWLHELLTVRPSLVDVTTANRLVKAIGVLGHQADVPKGFIVDCDGIPTTSVPWTLIDLMASLPGDWVERLVHEAVMRRLTDYDGVRVLAEARRIDECGAAMLGMLEGVGGTTPLEVQWARILKAAGIPEPVQQFQVVVDGQVFVLDFAWPDHKVALEVNGFAFHRTRDAFDRDHDKAVALQAAGWQVVAATAKTPPAHVLRALNLTFSTRGALVEKVSGG